MTVAELEFEIDSTEPLASGPGARSEEAVTPEAFARPESAPKRVLVAGGGVAGLEALLALRDLAGRRVQLTLLSPTDDFTYRPMTVAEPFGRGPAPHYSLTELAAALQVRLIHGELAAVDTFWKIAVTSNGASLAYDMLLVAVGTRPEPALHGALTWTPGSDPNLLGGLLRDIEEGYSKRIAFVVPPGVAWTLPLYELALMTASRAWSVGQDDVEIVIYTPEPAPLALLGSRASDAVRRELAQAGVETRTGLCVFDDALRPGRLITHGRDGRGATQHLDAERVVALPRAVAPGILGLPRDEDGFIPVDRHCRVRHTDAVWAAGDITTHAIKQGGLATQQADAAAEAIAVAAGADVHPTPFQPVLRGVMLTGRGSRWIRHASGGRKELDAATSEPWWPPTKLTGRYLTPFLTAVSSSEQIVATRPVGLPFTHDLDGQVASDREPRSEPRSVRGLS